MKAPNSRRTQKRKHAGRPSPVTAQTNPTAHTIALIRSSAIGAGCAFGIALLLLLLASFLIRNASDPIAFIFPVALGILYATALLSGTLAVRLHGKYPFLCGATSGAILLLLCLLIRCPVARTETTQAFSPILSQLAIPVFSVIGALILQRKPQAVPRRRRS